MLILQKTCCTSSQLSYSIQKGHGVKSVLLIVVILNMKTKIQQHIGPLSKHLTVDKVSYINGDGINKPINNRSDSSNWHGQSNISSCQGTTQYISKSYDELAAEDARRGYCLHQDIGSGFSLADGIASSHWYRQSGLCLRFVKKVSRRGASDSKWV